MMLFLLGSFVHYPHKVYSVAVHIVALSEFHRIFAYIWVVTGSFWPKSIFRVFNIFVAWSRVWNIAAVTP